MSHALLLICKRQPTVTNCVRYVVQAQIVDTLLTAVKLKNALSLPPILHLLSCLARDLQQDFLPYIPRVLAVLTGLIESGKRG